MKGGEEYMDTKMIEKQLLDMQKAIADIHVILNQCKKHQDNTEINVDTCGLDIIDIKREQKKILDLINKR